MRKEKAPIYKSSHSKAPKTQQICLYSHEKKTSSFFGRVIGALSDWGIGFSSGNTFASVGSFVKVPVPVGSIIPCTMVGILYTFVKTVPD